MLILGNDKNENILVKNYKNCTYFKIKCYQYKFYHTILINNILQNTRLNYEFNQ